MISLEEFAASDVMRPGKKCWLCGIPERAQAEKAIKDATHTKSQVARWLKTKYPEATLNRVTNHMRDHV